MSNSRQNIRPNPNQNNNYNQNQNYRNNQDQNQEEQQSSNQLQLSVASKRALDLLKKSRANRSAFMVIAPNETVRLQFDPTKSKPEKKTFNGQTTERISHSVVNVDDRAAGEKILSLTYKQSQPVEEAMEEGYTVMDITKVGEGFSLSYEINPIE
jgi:hypothetical protein